MCENPLKSLSADEWTGSAYRELWATKEELNSRCGCDYRKALSTDRGPRLR
jgi:hypothetical protein